MWRVFSDYPSDSTPLGEADHAVVCALPRVMANGVAAFDQHKQLVGFYTKNSGKLEFVPASLTGSESAKTALTALASASDGTLLTVATLGSLARLREHALGLL